MRWPVLLNCPLASVGVLLLLLFDLVRSSSVAHETVHKFHHTLKPEQLQHLFSVSSHSEVPPYDIVRVSASPATSSSSSLTPPHVLHLSAFGEQRVLRLTPNEHIAKNVPIFFADSDKTEGIKLTSLHQSGVDLATPYQDEDNQAALMIARDSVSKHLTIDGTIGSDLVMRSVPAELHELAQTATRDREEESQPNSIAEDYELMDDELANGDDLQFSDSLPLLGDDQQRSKPSEHESNALTSSDLPDGLELLRRRKRSDEVAEGGHYHVIYRRAAPEVDTDYAFLELDKIPLRSPGEGRSQRRKRDAPYVIYPEILVLVDYDGYLLHGQDNSKIKSYYVSFWNGVDLRYKLLKNPKVKVSIAGIIISRSRDAMPYLERNRVGRDAIDSASALTDMGKYLYQERRLPTYDIAVAITKLDMCRRGHKGGKCNRGTAGFAYVGGACVVNKRLQKVNSVAIVEDTGGFSGIIVAAHEVGHLLGAVHDGSPPPSYLGGPGARHCRWKDGYIMSDLRHTERGFRWSSCSVEQFKHFLNGETATCLYNLPHEDESLPRVLPGKLLTLDAQCKKDRGTTACFKDERVCAQLFCFDSASGFCVSYRPAAEGSECGAGKICLNGKCVYDNENSISHLDIHSLQDNTLSESASDSSVKDYSIPTTIKTPTTTTSTTTTSIPTLTTITTPTTQADFNSITTQRSIWRKSSSKPSSKHQKTTEKQTTTRRPTTRKRYNKPRKTTHWSNYRRKKTTTVPTPTTRKYKTTSKPYYKHYFKRTTTKRPFTTTTTTAKPTTTKRTYTKSIKNSRLQGSNDICEDTKSGGVGNLSCSQFLTNYGTRYCKHRYIEKNCCRTQKQLCYDLK